MFDTHCHLDDDAYDDDRLDVILRAKERGVVGILVPGWRLDSRINLRAWRESHPVLCHGVGLHPWYVHEIAPEKRATSLDNLADVAVLERAVAIGECGLDSPIVKQGGADLDTQEQVLQRHLAIANELHLPLILHCVNAHDRMLRILKHTPPKAGGVMHSYSGGRELVSEYVKLGLYISFAGIVTRDNARRPREALQAVPLERLLVESDGPDQAAKDVLPRRSEPAHVELVLRAAAALRKESLEALTAATTHNAFQLLRLSR